MKNKKSNNKSSADNVNSIYNRWKVDSEDLPTIKIVKSTKNNTKKGKK